MSHAYDAILIVSFGGPEGQDDVMPFLENVLRGRNVPRERMLEVAEHYRHFDGVSPINAQNRALIAALQKELDTNGPNLPIYWGNRNWHPMLKDTMQQMVDDGVKSAVAFVTSAFSSYSGCRQYRENMAEALDEIGHPEMEIAKIRVFYNHPGFINPMIENTKAALAKFPAEKQGDVQVIFTAHSIPNAMSASCRYEAQLNEACRLVAAGIGRDEHTLVFQSRSGPPQVPWLEPDICDYLKEIHSQGVRDVAIVPIGFTSDHMEVLFDLDTEAQELCESLGMNCQRVQTVGTHPEFIRMVRELILERLDDSVQPQAIGQFGPNHHTCPATCCLPGHGRPLKPAVSQMPADSNPSTENHPTSA